MTSPADVAQTPQLQEWLVERAKKAGATVEVSKLGVDVGGQPEANVGHFPMITCPKVVARWVKEVVEKAGAV